LASPEIELLLDVIIVGELIALLYLWYEKKLFPFTPQAVAVVEAPFKPGREERETVKDIVDAKLTEIKELSARKDNLEAVIKQAKQKYMRGEIAASTYRGVINDSEKELVEIEARLKLLAKTGK